MCVFACTYAGDVVPLVALMIDARGDEGGVGVVRMRYSHG
jgi:hypothetical protein